jgi:hypothetical protein
MKRGILTLGLLLGFAQFVLGQTNRNGSQVNLKKTTLDAAPMSYLVIGATADQETLLRSQIQAMHPEVLPLRIFLVPHWKYVDAARTFRLHVPTGMSSVMFTHLASRTVFIDNDHYLGAEWLGYWMAHELGHLVTNSVDEHEADGAARVFRKRLKDARNEGLL